MPADAQHRALRHSLLKGTVKDKPFHLTPCKKGERLQTSRKWDSKHIFMGQSGTDAVTQSCINHVTTLYSV